MIKAITFGLLMLTGVRSFSQQSTDSSLAKSNVQITVIDSTSGSHTPARVRISQHNRVAKAISPQAIAVMYGVWDHADGYEFQPDSSFYVNGYFEMELPAGSYTLTLSKGLEYLDQIHTIKIESEQTFRKTYSMVRWINMPDRGWYSADDHIHIRRSPREDSLLLQWIQAENINVGVLLRMGDFWETYYAQYAWGDKGVYHRGNHLLTSGQEDPRTPELGHVLGFGASDRVRYKNEYYYYDKVFDKLHELGGLGGYAHQAESFHGYRGLIMDGLRGKVDILELLQFCVSQDPLQTRHYYHLLDMGYPITAVAGSDFPWCGKDHDNGPVERNARIGNVRFYTYIGDNLTYENWKQSVKQGRTFVTSGPILDFKINTKLPGYNLGVKKKTKLTIAAHAYGHTSQVPLERLEIISHGKVIASAEANQRGQSPSHLFIEMKIPATQGAWFAARSFAGKGQAAHTTPIYISVDGNGFHNPSTLQHYLQLSEDYLKELENELKEVNSNPEYQSWRYRKGLEMRIEETRGVIDEIRKKR